jgi:hypothetical protein
LSFFPATCTFKGEKTSRFYKGKLKGEKLEENIIVTDKSSGQDYLVLGYNCPHALTLAPFTIIAPLDKKTGAMVIEKFIFDKMFTKKEGVPTHG